mmetsp:Transcript_80813/g.226667  ORF Transcript_80813/g.226667 Transcript_80813/m.226667 type:complete len:239 (-) Transcript_80813:80-796(-)
MSDSAYRKTPLPVKLNLNDRNTRVQLSTGAPESENGRGALEGVGVGGNPSSQSQKNCTDVMRKDLQDWLTAHGIEGPAPSPEAEQRAMWQWMRDFHKEYNDDWFARNMPRLHKQFRPVFLDEMKARKAAVTAAAPAPATDLLDFPAAAQQTSAAPAPASDLLGFDAASTPAPAPSAGVDMLGEVAPAPPAASAGGLLDLDFVGAPGVDASKQPAAAGAHATPAGAQGSGAADLLDLAF